MTENKSQQQEQEEISLYAKIVARTEELMNSGRKTFDEALKKAAEEISTAGDYTRDQSERIAGFVRRDLGHAAEHINKTTNACQSPAGGDSDPAINETNGVGVHP